MLNYNRLGQAKLRTPVSFRLHYTWESYSRVSSRPVGSKCSVNLSCFPEVVPTFTPLATPSHKPAIKYSKGHRARELRVTEGLAGHQHTPGRYDTGSLFYSFSLSFSPCFVSSVGSHLSATVMPVKNRWGVGGGGTQANIAATFRCRSFPLPLPLPHLSSS